MPLLLQRARDVAALFARHERATVTPDPPHTSMFHLTLRGDAEELLCARDRVAQETGIWLFNKLQPMAGQAAARAELSMGPSSLSLTDEEVAAAIALLLR
jgi:hypothetical protein